MTYAIIKGVGPLSAGSRIEIYNGIPFHNEIPCELLVKLDNLVELRNKIDLVPLNNRAKRRASKRAEHEIMKGLGF